MQTAPAQLRTRVQGWFGAPVAGGAAVVVTAVLLFIRFGLHLPIGSNQAIYAYGGQQLARGVVPYVSIFDPKTPLATLLSGLGAALGRLFGHSELAGSRVVFCVLSVLTVLAVYLLALELWKSVAAATVAAVVFASFYRFALDALGGPEPKTTLLLPIVMSMYFTARRQWFRAGLFGGIAVLAWQPLLGFVLVTFVLAVTLGDAVTQQSPSETDPSDPSGAADVADVKNAAEAADATVLVTEASAAPSARPPHWRALGRAAAGAVIPIALVSVFFAAAGAWHEFVESAVEFPLVGRTAPQRTFGKQISTIVEVVHQQFKFSATLLWAGTILLVVFVVAAFVRHRAAPLEALKDPVVSVVAFGWVLQVAFMLYDFEGGPDLFPVLPAAAVCLGGLFAVAVNACRGNARQLATAVTFVAALALAVASWVQFGLDQKNTLIAQRELSNACGVQRTVSRTGTLWVMGNPVPLVLTLRTNPDRFIYLGQGGAEWKVRHTEGGFEGWMAQVAAVNPNVVLIDQFRGQLELDTTHWLREHGYHRYYIGKWKIFVLNGVRAGALARGVQITRQPTKAAIDETGARLSTDCGIPRIG